MPRKRRGRRKKLHNTHIAWQWRAGDEGFYEDEEPSLEVTRMSYLFRQNGTAAVAGGDRSTRYEMSQQSGSRSWSSSSNTEPLEVGGSTAASVPAGLGLANTCLLYTSPSPRD